MSAFARGRGDWQRVTRGSPCPVCGQDDWCSVSGDGTLAKCMRVAADSWRTKKDKNGAEYYLHRLDGTARPGAPPPRPPGPATPRADADLLHRAYDALLARLPLADRHRQALRARGLSDEDIDRSQYRTLPVQGRARLARAVRDRLGDALLSVPGFVVKAGKGGRPYVTVAGAAGLLVPVRDPAGRVVAVLARRDEGGDGPRYSYLSSAKHGGPGPGTPPHVPLGTTAPCATVRLTEGALKADVAGTLSGVPTVGAAGLAWRPGLDAVRELGARTVRLSFDADAPDKAQVARALSACCDAAPALGLAVELERWDKSGGKGIDDLLAAGKEPEVLAGEAARAAVRAILAEATAGAPPPPSPVLARVREALDAGGAEAVYHDGKLLADLARLAEDDPAEFACARAAAKGPLSLRDLDRALAPYRQAVRRERPPPDAAGMYREAGGRVVRDVLTKDGAVEVPLANWSGRIVEEVVRDDGAERHLLLAVEGALADGTPLPRVEVPAADYAWMRWPVERWGTRAVVLAGASTADHLRCALQLLSGDVPRRTVYGHTGWREVGGRWVYLHAGGALGPGGPSAGVEVDLPDTLAGYLLPDPPAGAELAAAVRASLALLGGPAPDRIAFPLQGAVWRAALGEAPGPIDLSLFLAGQHGAGKTELATLAQQHYGPGLDARHLPGSWLSTGNALEGLAFAAKDALLVIDDWAPRAAPGDRQRLEREADRVLRAAGNRAGRGRCRADGSLRPARPPRGLILSTGEDVPPGQSLRGRLLVLELARDELVLAALTPHQEAAAAGLYARALAGFICWLAPRYGELCRRLPGERAALRDRARAEAAGGSPRTPGIVADLALGLSLFLDFAEAAGALAPAGRADLTRRGWRALLAVAAEQAAHVEAADPVGLYLRLLTGALASGRAHVAGPDGDAPADPAAWGWRQESTRDGPAWRPQGRRVGWLGVGAGGAGRAQEESPPGADKLTASQDSLFLEPEASYAEAQELAREQGDSLPVSPRTLWRRLRERGLLVTWDAARQRCTVRHYLGGTRRYVIHLRPGLLSAQEPDRPDQCHENPEKNGQVAANPTGNPPQRRRGSL
jgi:hypothetical protein